MKHVGFIGFTIIVFLSSCAYHMGTVGGGTGVVTNQHYRSIDIAYGTAHTTNFLGIGGNKKDALVLEAKRNLYLNYKLRPTQIIGQTTVDFKRTFFFPVLTTKVTVSAEIIDFSMDSTNDVQSEASSARFTEIKRGGQFEIGKNVLYFKKAGRVFQARILDYQEGRYVVKYIDEYDNLRIRYVPSASIKPLDESIKAIKDPLKESQPEKLFTPHNPEKQLMGFMYKGEYYVGELIEKSGSYYVIKMEKGNGDRVSLYISEENIVK
jgi:hypothetical protein